MAAASAFAQFGSCSCSYLCFCSCSCFVHAFPPDPAPPPAPAPAPVPAHAHAPGPGPGPAPASSPSPIMMPRPLTWAVSAAPLCHYSSPTTLMFCTSSILSWRGIRPLREHAVMQGCTNIIHNTYFRYSGNTFLVKSTVLHLIALEAPCTI